MKNINVIVFDNLEIIWCCIKEMFVSSFSSCILFVEYGGNFCE